MTTKEEAHRFQGETIVELAEMMEWQEAYNSHCPFTMPKSVQDFVDRNIAMLKSDIAMWGNIANGWRE